MKRTELSGGVRERLVRLPAPYEHHYGVLPLPLPEEGIPLEEITAVHSEAQLALGQADEIARSLPDPYQISRILSRREAVSSSAMEGTHSTLDELLIADEDDDQGGRWFDRFGITRWLWSGSCHRLLLRAVKSLRSI